MKSNEYFMRKAIEQAMIAQSEGEVPIGAVITLNDDIIAVGRNKRERCKNALSHAEIEAINNACEYLKSWRLLNCKIYVTLEPCPMCAGAIINSRISSVIYGAHDPKAGSCNSIIDLFALPYNHKPSVVSGVLQDECSAILSDFFQNLRESKN